MTSGTTAAAHERCFAHPTATGRTYRCRECERFACDDCRTTELAGGIPIVLCSGCAASLERRRTWRRVSAAAGPVAIVLVIMALAWHAAFAIPAVLLVLWALAMRRWVQNGCPPGMWRQLLWFLPWLR